MKHHEEVALVTIGRIIDRASIAGARSVKAEFGVQGGMERTVTYKFKVRFNNEATNKEKNS